MLPIHNDYVIVGAGSAGCVLAGRLSESFSSRVLLLEAGPIDGSVTLEMPLAFPLALRSRRYNWAYYTEPEPHLDNRRLYYPRGRVLGGSSAVDALVWVRGHALDFEGWADEGLSEWAYPNCLPYFKRSESSPARNDDYRGKEGPMRVSTGAGLNPLHRAFVDAGLQAGYPSTDDPNGYQREGFGAWDMSVHRGRRWSAARGYMDATRGRDNFKRELEARVLRLLCEGRRVVGVEYERLGIVQKVFAEKEVILCAGSINTPQLLMVSGLGPADHLRERGVEVVVDLPGVGSDLQDHTDLHLRHRSKEPVSLYPATTPAGKLLTVAKWLVGRRGLGSSNQFEIGGFIRSRAGVEHPDLQLHFMPMAASYDGSYMAPGHSYQASLSVLRPSSRGTVRLRSSDPLAPPVIRLNFCARQEDRQLMRSGVRLAREILRQAAFECFNAGELEPGDDVLTDAEIDAFVRARTESKFHPTSSCRMGLDDAAVVDGEGRVHGVEQLRIVDASIMPRVVSANPNATVIMMAEKLADRILGRTPLAPEPAPFYRAPDWRQTQR